MFWDLPALWPPKPPPPPPTFEEWLEQKRREEGLRKLREDLAKRYEIVEGG